MNMSGNEATSSASSGQQQDTTQEQQQLKHEERHLHESVSSTTRSIIGAIAIKNDNVFFLSREDGNVPCEQNHAYGLYYHDTRFLNGYELRMADVTLNVSLATASEGCTARFELTNPDIQMPDGTQIKQEQIGFKWERVVDADGLSLCEQITIENYQMQPVSFPISLTYQSGFEAVFAIRSLAMQAPGKNYPPTWKNGVLFFHYHGADDLYRSLSVHFSLAPTATEQTKALYQIDLQPRESKKIEIFLDVAQAPQLSEVEPKQHAVSVEHVKTSVCQPLDTWLHSHMAVSSDNKLLDRIIGCSLRDLRVLLSYRRGQMYFSAGIPWYVALFGRDSLISSMQVLAYEPEVAEHTLRLLASYQGTKVDNWQDEEPGRILHELRLGELAHLHDIPQTPYYGTVDATILFLIVLCLHATWTGKLDVFNDLQENVERALGWMANYTDLLHNGYVAYLCRSKDGLRNQGWKDSGEAIVNEDGSLATPPIALVEVQGYAYLAKTLLADLYQRVGEMQKANQLRQEAAHLQQRFNQDYWMQDKQFFAQAIQKGNSLARVIASNPGQALWTGIVDSEKAKKTMQRLLDEDMFSGWGIRTLSSKERRYNPLAYEIGSVWPHDNSIICAGFKRYGFDEAACRVFTAIFEAGIHFGDYRLPELFAGFEQDVYGDPARYPIAAHPQAWAAGALPFMVTTLLGLQPDAFEHRLRIVRPVLPEVVNYLELRRLRVGEACADLRFERISDGSVAVKVLKVEGQLEVVLEPEGKNE
jgi:glycogen debranching enzyme